MENSNLKESSIIESEQKNQQLFVSLEGKSKRYVFITRTMDIIFSFFGLIIMLPLFSLISFCYLYGDSKGPVFFKQARVGKNKKIFYIYKFRSMIVNAEEKLRQDPRLYKKYLENNYKLEQEEDPRITNLGRFLRSTSLDEIPQLINVLKGDMSLVGPRPIVEEELREYGFKSNDLVSVKPGITGYWAVSGRSNVDYPERADLELHYVYNQSIKLDIHILFKTVLAVIVRKGAY
ncbi:sugar transferase [Priestia megaterium]|uniref:sugar transferase n=1 Tax=Priestia megaterium TaxID=1404 RepID=UPI000BEE606C|nr:sugar transferase [Priestia megaterium]PED65889.1 multidrug MFS transporter [Priestia megaterium]